ncbi:MAG: ABC transporter ATP-binding protein [Chryseolinea sp.]
MLKISDLTFSYRKKHRQFDSLTLALQPGSITGLLGKNGAGKTTLLKIIAGSLFPQTGSVEVLNHTPGKREPSFLAHIFFVPEEFDLPSIPIKTFIKANAPFYPSFDAGLMTRLLKEFELSEDTVIDKQSYGQKKKFLISFALATKCRLLVLDEPTNGLDIPSKIIFRKVMAGNLDDNQLVLISTHQVKDVETLIDTIIILDQGKVILHKEIQEIASELQFTNSHTGVGSDVMYSEMVPGGYKVISQQINGSSSIDLELLFNAVTKGVKIFQQKQKVTL